MTRDHLSVCLPRCDSILILGGVQEDFDNYLKRFQLVDLKALKVTELRGQRQELLDQDFFYFNQFSLSRDGTRMKALGLEHIHEIDLISLRAISLAKGDGDYPTNDAEND